jgi:ParB family chromosome partitioning protein
VVTSVTTIDPSRLVRNPENPRLIFRSEELQALEDSIKSQGILVPLTVYRDGQKTVILDGERRWRCARKLGLSNVPVIVQPKPGRMQNIMMMFAIHHARTDWDPLPTAFKLRDLEKAFHSQNRRYPNETELAELASMRRTEVRRLKKLLSLPSEYQDELLKELEKPRHLQTLTVDHVLEATIGAEALVKRGVIPTQDEEPLRRSIINKFRTKVINNTTDPRMLSRIARSVERGDVSQTVAARAVRKLVQDESYSIKDAFGDSAAQADFTHSTEQLAERLLTRLGEMKDSKYELDENLKRVLIEIRALIEDHFRL